MAQRTEITKCLETRDCRRHLRKQSVYSSPPCWGSLIQNTRGPNLRPFGGFAIVSVGRGEMKTLMVTIVLALSCRYALCIQYIENVALFRDSKDLTLSIAELHKKGKNPIIDQIKILKFSKMKVDGKMLNVALTSFPKAHSLSFWQAEVGKVDDLPKTVLDRITDIQVYSGTFKKKALEALSKSTSLKTLSLGFNAGVETEDDLEALDGTNLEVVFLQGDYSSKVFSLFRKLPHLRDFQLESTLVIDKQQASDFLTAKRRDKPDFRLEVRSRGALLEGL